MEQAKITGKKLHLSVVLLIVGCLLLGEGFFVILAPLWCVTASFIGAAICLFIMSHLKWTKDTLKAIYLDLYCMLAIEAVAMLMLSLIAFMIRI